MGKKLPLRMALVNVAAMGMMTIARSRVARDTMKKYLNAYRNSVKSYQVIRRRVLSVRTITTLAVNAGSIARVVMK